MSLIASILAASLAHIAPVASTEAGANTPDNDKMICKKFPPPTGTRLRARKICATKQEWALQEQTRDTQMDNLQGRTGYQEQDGGP